jgi:hypothetical protein
MADHPIDILVRAKDMASRTIGNIEKRVGSLGRIGSKAVSNLTANFVRFGVVAAGALTGAVALGVRSLGDLARTQAQTNAVIASTKGAAGQSSEAIRKHAEELEALSTVDDQVIQDGQNMLLTFTNIKGKVFPQATKATLNLAVAMAAGNAEQVDMKASAIQLGKALNDPIKGVTALRKVGVSFTEQQQKQIKTLVKSGKLYEAQQIILKELEIEFGNAAKAAGTGPEAVWRRLQDAGEDLSMALAKRVLPVLERGAKWLTTKLADPAVIKFMDDLGAGLADAADEALRFIEKVDWGSIGAGLKGAADIAGSIVGMFMGLPDWVKTAVITGWGLNKLTGGAVTDLIGVLGSGLIKGVLGMNAGVVNINAGVVNGAGGLPGKGGGSLIGGIIPAAAILGIGYLIGEGITTAMGGPTAGREGGRGRSIAGTPFVFGQHTGAQVREESERRRTGGANANVTMGGFDRRQIRQDINIATGGFDRRLGAVGQAIQKEQSAVDRFRQSASPSLVSMKAHLGNLENLERNSAGQSTTDRIAIVNAINSLRAVIGTPPTVNVNVTASDISSNNTRRGRTVKPHGPRNTLVGMGGH